MVHAAYTPNVNGPMNGVAPQAVRNKEFTKSLAGALHRPAFLPVPYFGIRVAFGEFAKILFASQHVVPEVAQRSGFVFQYPTLDGALAEILQQKPVAPREPELMA